MAVKVLLTSGAHRVIDADEVRVSGPFFLLTQSYPHVGRARTILTLLAKDVVVAEIEKDGVVTDYVPGRGLAEEA